MRTHQTQLELFSKLSDIRKLYEWLLDGTELRRLEKLKAEALVNRRKYQSSRYLVRNLGSSISRHGQDASSSALDRGNQSRKIG